MLIIPVATSDEGGIYALFNAPAEAICTVTTPAGCEVYVPGDEQLLAERLQVSSEE